MKKYLVSFLLMGTLLFCGCAAVAALLPKVVAAVTDAGLILDAVESFTAQLFAKAPDPALQAKVEAAIQKARAAADLALRAVQGGEALSQKDVDAAFADFRLAYAALMELVGPLGVHEVVPGPGRPLGLEPGGGLSVPRPKLLEASGGA